jgi:predicted Ser/Thr protein kinase
MENFEKAMENLNRSMSNQDQYVTIPFEQFLKTLTEKPSVVMRNIFQVFHDMVNHYITKGIDEYPDDPESIGFVNYDCSKLFVDDSDHPFFADRLFANRLINHVVELKKGAQQNKIYIFKGPPGCGKSTFLNNLLKKFEEYTHTENGLRYETVWRLDRKLLGSYYEHEDIPLLEKLSQLLGNIEHGSNRLNDQDDFSGSTQDHYPLFEDYQSSETTGDYLEIPCPSHDDPVLMIPKEHRRSFFDDLFKNDEFKWKLSTEKEYEWVFKDIPCTICSSLYQSLLNRLKSPHKVFQMIYARPYLFNRRLGEGISVFNPGDKPMRQIILSNAMLQRRINSILRDSNLVKYIFSRFAKTNNGIYALMDIKSHNTERLIDLHNIISEGIHKVEDIEENVNSLFIAVMNPEDKKNIQGFQSFSDRIEYMSIPYVLDLNTEVEIYRNIFGRHIDESFLPIVLYNFARVIISTRLKTKSEALLEWIEDPDKYRLYCDKNLQLLKMEIYTGNVPSWLTEEDRKRFTAKRRKKIIAESETEGEQGFSGRDSIKIFNEFYSLYAKEDKLINMSMLRAFFDRSEKDSNILIPEGFIDSLVQMYDYAILQKVKESLYYYNEQQISRDIQNYLFSLNFEIDSVETCQFTGDKLEITEDFLESIEIRLLDPKIDTDKRMAFRKDIQKEYTSRTLTQEIMVEGKTVPETKLYKSLHERYVHNLKAKVLDPFLENENFRRGIKDYNEEAFKTYDKRIREDVTFMMNNLCTKYNYTARGAKEICIYVIDNDITQKFSNAEK